MYCFFCKQKTAYEMRISDWSSDVCSSDLQIVERATCLLRIDQIFRNVARILDCLLHFTLRDFVKHHALDWLVLQRVFFAQQFGQMPRNRLALAIRVGRKPELVSALERGNDRPHVLFEIGRASCGEKVCQYV